MSLQVEKLEKNMAKLTVEVSAEEFDKALTAAYNKNKGRFNIPGFRKGKAPQAMTGYCLFFIKGSREPGQITCCRLKQSWSVSYARGYIDNDTKIQECWTS